MASYPTPTPTGTNEDSRMIATGADGCCTASSTCEQRLKILVEQFQGSAGNYLGGVDINTVAIMGAWLLSDIVILDLFNRYTKLRPIVVAVDTLHLFPETHVLASEVQQRYPDFQYIIPKPDGCETREDFIANYGHPVEMGKTPEEADLEFDRVSKIAPLNRALTDAATTVKITGRRWDQGFARTAMSVFQEGGYGGQNTFNPLADWTWHDVTQYVLKHSLPYNALHHRAFTSNMELDPKYRDPTSMRSIDLEKPFFAYTEKQLCAHGKHVYVWKSFGDVHTSTVVTLAEGERDGRFVHRSSTECGIHGRGTRKGDAHGGVLINCGVETDKAAHLDKCTHTLQLNDRQACDLELIAVGGLSPLSGFMTLAQYDSCVEKCRLPENELFGLPITLDTDSEEIKIGDYVRLVHTKWGALASIKVTDKWTPDRWNEAKKCFLTDSSEHPAVVHLTTERAKYNIGGPIYVRALPERDWVTCRTPREIRAKLDHSKPKIFFQTRNPTHRAHAAMFLRVSKEHAGAQVIVNPIIGPSKSDDVPANIRVLTYEKLSTLPELADVTFEYLPYSMMVGGPRECLQHMIIRKNYGATGMIVGRDHAGCKDFSGKDFYLPTQAQEFVSPLVKELHVDMIPFKAMVYVKEENQYIELAEAKLAGYTSMSISGTKFRAALRDNLDIPTWFAFPEVISILREWAQAVSNDVVDEEKN